MTSLTWSKIVKENRGVAGGKGAGSLICDEVWSGGKCVTLL